MPKNHINNDRPCDSVRSIYEKYQTDSLNDELQHCIEWVATYDFFVKTKRKLDAIIYPDTE